MPKKRSDLNTFERSKAIILLIFQPLIDLPEDTIIRMKPHEKAAMLDLTKFINKLISLQKNKRTKTRHGYVDNSADDDAQLYQELLNFVPKIQNYKKMHARYCGNIDMRQDREQIKEQQRKAFSDFEIRVGQACQGFIQNLLDNDFDRAKITILQDTVNKNLHKNAVQTVSFAQQSAAQIKRGLIECIQAICASDAENSYRYDKNTGALARPVNGKLKTVCAFMPPAPPKAKAEPEAGVKLGTMKFNDYKDMKVAFLAAAKLCKESAEEPKLDIRGFEFNLETITKPEQLAGVFLAYNEVFNADYKAGEQYITNDNAFLNSATFKKTEKLDKVLQRYDRFDFEKWLDANAAANQIAQEQLPSLIRAHTVFMRHLDTSLRLQERVTQPAARSRLGRPS